MNRINRCFTTEIVLKTEELYADIANRLTLTADSMEAQGGDTDLSNTKDALDDGNREIVTGLIARFVYECMNIMYPYAKTPIRECRRDDNSDEVEAYAVALTFERMRSETCLCQLARLMHDYIVYKCYAEWLAMTMPVSNIHAMWEQKAADVREQIATTLVLPYEPKRLRIRPHWY